MVVLEEILRKIQIEEDKAVLPVEVLEDLLEEIFYSPEEETRSILADEKMREAIEKFESGKARYYSLKEAMS
ncbi:hypothetical protein [Thermosulfurimonas sp.]|uniref:hypothetical protein n=1 Tax=Thermosulfurimonas sp. TaxID=2080236 RepID=UPI0025DCA210|nr:hypothetical protein [Thermosulfurimonas sp.]